MNPTTMWGLDWSLVLGHWSFLGRCFGNLLAVTFELRFAVQAARDLSHRLAQTVLVFDQRQPQVALAGGSKSHAGTDRHVPLFEQHHGEVERFHFAGPWLGD